MLSSQNGWVEWAMGRDGGNKGLHSAQAIMGLMAKGSIARYFGVIGVLIPLGVSFYYVFIEAWTFGYFLKYLTGGIGVDAAAPVAEQAAAAGTYYTKFTGAAGDGVLFSRDGMLTIIS